MKVILAWQHSAVEKAIGGSLVWNMQKRGWDKVPRSTFKSIERLFPDSIIEVEAGERPIWGSAYYKEGADGFCELVSGNWDSSG